MLAKEGEHGNVIYLMPPICFSEKDVVEVLASCIPPPIFSQVVRSLDEALAEGEVLGLDRMQEAEEEVQDRPWHPPGLMALQQEEKYADMD